MIRALQSPWAATLWIVAVVLCGCAISASSRRNDRQAKRMFPYIAGPGAIPVHTTSSPAHTVLHALLAAIGRSVNTLMPRPIQASPAFIGKAISVALIASVISPILGIATLTVAAVHHRRTRRRTAQHRVAEVRAELGLVLDLLRVAVSAGMTLRQAIVVVCSPNSAETGTSAGELAAMLLTAVQGVSRGERFIDSIALIVEAPVIGQELRLLASTLISTERFGTPPGPALATLASDVRDFRRRLAETEARRVPVRMLAPLVLLLLPSFALLTIAPLLAGGFGSLRLTP